MTIKGITNESIETLGSTEITLFDKPITFQVINDNLSLTVNGILGANFLSEESAQISFHHNALITYICVLLYVSLDVVGNKKSCGNDWSFASKLEPLKNLLITRVVILLLL